VDRFQYLDALEEASAAFFEAVSRCPLSAPVPSCPDWTVADLVYHLGGVHRFWGEVVARRLSSPSGVERSQRPAPEDLVTWAREQAGALQAALAEAEPTTPVWTWAAQQEVAFVDRRMAQETTVHRWDAQLAAGTPERIDPELASDGVDEFLTVMVADPRFTAPIGGSVHVHATDTPGEWLITEGDDGAVVVTREHAKGAVALRGPADQLLLGLWGRVPLDDLEIIGDRSVAERLLTRTSLG
jgi:uncharacterized protein (TIGR03083 family)